MKVNLIVKLTNYGFTINLGKNEISLSYEIELRNQVTENDVTFAVANSNNFIEPFPWSY